ncbi:dodecin family protein [Herbaspirillum sp. WKF16]|jgi:flavin-binding protein dodecin|uniref:dodecin n=1 Tax=Herbaspirillum sp. WKF16 TaxID=3028312 RepID=UPI0023A91CC7|nr:dodecin [Herbaspirillum sp. WKF16]WDZ94247.1 dodecin family protein [Herbaspirillum sp. WKF16]
MSERKQDDSSTYKVIEVVGTSPKGSDEAIRNAIADVVKTVKHVDWFEVTECRGHVENGNIGHFQVSLRVGFRVEA